jgi:hypothetical protein
MAISRSDTFDFLIDIVPRDDIKSRRSGDEAGKAFISPELQQYYFSLQQQALAQQQQGAEGAARLTLDPTQMQLLYQHQQQLRLLQLQQAQLLQLQMQQQSQLEEQIHDIEGRQGIIEIEEAPRHGAPSVIDVAHLDAAAAAAAASGMVPRVAAVGPVGVGVGVGGVGEAEDGGKYGTELTHELPTRSLLAHRHMHGPTTGHGRVGHPTNPAVGGVGLEDVDLPSDNPPPLNRLNNFHHSEHNNL